jgi:hypothetical protein
VYWLVPELTQYWVDYSQEKAHGVLETWVCTYVHKPMNRVSKKPSNHKAFLVHLHNMQFTGLHWVITDEAHRGNEGHTQR